MICGVIFVSLGRRIQPIVLEYIYNNINNPFEYWQVEIGIVLGSYEAIILQQNSSISIHQLLSDDDDKEDIFISIKNNVECKPTTELLCQICTVGHR